MTQCWMGWFKRDQRTRVGITAHKYQHALVGKLLLTKAIKRILLSCKFRIRTLERTLCDGD